VIERAQFQVGGEKAIDKRIAWNSNVYCETRGGRSTSKLIPGWLALVANRDARAGVTHS